MVSLCIVGILRTFICQYFQSITNITWQINSRFGTAAIDSAPAQWGLAGYSKCQADRRCVVVLPCLNAAITGIVN